MKDSPSSMSLGYLFLTQMCLRQADASEISKDISVNNRVRNHRTMVKAE